MLTRIPFIPICLPSIPVTAATTKSLYSPFCIVLKTCVPSFNVGFLPNMMYDGTIGVFSVVLYVILPKSDSCVEWHYAFFGLCC